MTVPDVPDLGEHGLYSCPRWLRMLELGGRKPAEYLTGQADAAPVGLLPFHLTPVSGNPRYSRERLLRGLGDDGAPTALCYGGSLSAYQTEIPVSARHDACAAYAELIALAQRRSVAAQRVLVLPYLTDRAARLLPPEHSRSLLFEDAEAWFTSPAADLADHLASLPRKQRQNLTRDLRIFARAGLNAGVEPLRDCLEIFARLVAESSLKHGQAYGEQGLADHLRTIEEVFGDDAIVFTARDASGRLVGGVLGIFHRGELYLRMTGFDQRATAGTSAYFHLAYYTPLDLRADRPHQRVHHGTGLLPMKHRHGATVSPLWTLMLGRPLGDLTRINRERAAGLLAGLPAGVTRRLTREGDQEGTP